MIEVCLIESLRKKPSFYRVFSFSLTESYETRASSLEVIESYNEATNKLKPELPIIAFASVSVSLLHHILGIVF